MALDTVQDYVASARVLLQDLVAPYRYSDAELVDALNLSLLDGRRLRPDLFLSSPTPQSFVAANATSGNVAVNVDYMYRTAFLYYICGHAQLRDEEDTTDARANQYRGKFSAILLTLS